MVLDAPLRDQVRKTALKTAKVGKMGLGDTERAILIEAVEKGLSDAYHALLVLRREKDNMPIPTHSLFDRRELHDLVETGEQHLNYEKAIEQAIDLIVDSGAEEGSTDDFGQHVGGPLQTALMMAVYLKSDIFDHLDGPHI